MINKNFFICFIGIDGSGKSTQANKLVESLSRAGINSKYIYGRNVPIIFKPILILGNLFFLRKKNIKSDYEDYFLTKRGALKKYNILSQLFYKIMLLDYYLQIIYKIKIPILLNKNIVCDRYIYDTIITDIAVDMGYSEEETFELIEKCSSFIPKPDIIFLIDLPEEIAYSRKDDVSSLNYLKDRRKYYLAVANKYNMVKINGTEKMENIEKEILYRVSLKLEELK